MSSIPKARPHSRAGPSGSERSAAALGGLHHLQHHLAHAEEGLPRGAARRGLVAHPAQVESRPPRARPWCGREPATSPPRGRARPCRWDAALRQRAGARRAWWAARPARRWMRRGPTIPRFPGPGPAPRGEGAPCPPRPGRPPPGSPRRPTRRAGPRSPARPASAVPWPSPSGRTLEPSERSTAARGPRLSAMGAIVARAPLRVALGGGGTDLPSYYRSHGGFVVSTAIDRYVHMMVSADFQSRYRLKHLEWEEMDDPAEVRHPDPARGVRAALGRAAGGAGLGVGRPAGHRPRLLRGLRGLLRSRRCAPRPATGRPWESWPRRPARSRSTCWDGRWASRTSTRPRTAACGPTRSTRTTRWRPASSWCRTR